MCTTASAVRLVGGTSLTEKYFVKGLTGKILSSITTTTTTATITEFTNAIFCLNEIAGHRRGHKRGRKRRSARSQQRYGLWPLRNHPAAGRQALPLVSGLRAAIGSPLSLHGSVCSNVRARVDLPSSAVFVYIRESYTHQGWRVAFFSAR